MRKNFYPIALELEYGKLWASVVANVCKSFCRQIIAAQPADRQAERADSQEAARYDAPSLAEVLAFINELKEKEGSRINTAVLKSRIKKQLKFIDAWSRSKTSEVLQRNITRLTTPQPDLSANRQAGQAVELLMQVVNIHQGVSEEFIDAAVDKNVGLIKQLLGASLDSIAAAAKESFVAGEGHAALTKRLMTQAGAVEKKAKFWARDQASKFFGAVTKERQTKAGLPGYVWRTMEDERVRDRHRKVDGKYFAWNDPPAVGSKGERLHPGEDYNCRCWAEPAFGPEYADVTTTAEPSAAADPEERPVRASEEYITLSGKSNNKGGAKQHPVKKSSLHAKNVEEAEKLAKKFIADEANYAGVNEHGLARVNEWNAALYDITKEYPLLRSLINFTGTEKGRVSFAKVKGLEMPKRIRKEVFAVAFNNPEKGISGFVLNTGKINDESSRKLLVKNAADGYHPKGTGSIQGIAYHEAAHKLIKLLSLDKDKKLDKLWYRYLKEKPDPLGEKGLSRYAFENRYEFIAEAFAEYKCNPRCRPLARKIGEKIDKLYNKLNHKGR